MKVFSFWVSIWKRRREQEENYHRDNTWLSRGRPQLSTTQRYLVHCHRGGFKQLENDKCAFFSLKCDWNRIEFHSSNTVRLFIDSLKTNDETHYSRISSTTASKMRLFSDFFPKLNVFWVVEEIRHLRTSSWETLIDTFHHFLTFLQTTQQIGKWKESFVAALPALPTMQLITGGNLSDHMRLPLQPQKASHYLFSHMQQHLRRVKQTVMCQIEEPKKLIEMCQK